MARRRRIHIYWLQFVIAAFWVGVIEVFISGKVPLKIHHFIVDILVILTGILAFEPIGRHILKYLLISFVASFLIQGLRELGQWYMAHGGGFWRMGGPVVALFVITVILYMIGAVTNKDRVRF